MDMNGEITTNTAATAPPETMCFTGEEVKALLRVIGRVECCAREADEERPIHGLELAIRSSGPGAPRAPFAAYAWATDGHRMHIASVGDVREVVQTYHACAYGKAREDFVLAGHGGSNAGNAGFRFLRLTGKDVGRFTAALRKKPGEAVSLSFLRFEQSAGPRTGATLIRVVELDVGLGWRSERERFTTRAVGETPHLKVVPQAANGCDAGVTVDRKACLETVAAAAERNRRDDKGHLDTHGVVLAIDKDGLTVREYDPGPGVNRYRAPVKARIAAHRPPLAGTWGVDGTYLRDALRAAMPQKDEALLGHKRAGAVTVALCGDLDPIVIRQGDASETAPGEDGESPETFVAVVMPMWV